MDRSAETHSFKGYDIPIDLLMKTGGGPETFDVIASVHLHCLKHFLGVEPQHRVVELGCGIGRDAIPLTEYLVDGEYLGIDIIEPSVRWCAENITPRHPSFRFVHFDVRDELHNPGGSLPNTIRIPVASGSVDRIFAFSVFTHMASADIAHYLEEFRRILKPGGVVYATTFVYDDAILAKARANAERNPHDLTFMHEYGPGCRISNLEHPMGAVAYERERWHEMIAASGLKLQRMLRGAWSGFYEQADEGQDVVMLTR